MGLRQKCIICGNENAQLGYDIQNDSLIDYQYYHCPSCGRYIIPESSSFLFNDLFSRGQSDLYDKVKLRGYLLHNKIERRNAFIGTQEAFEAYIKIKPNSEAFLVTKETVENWYPKTFAEKIDKILLNLAQRTKYFGDSAHFSSAELSPMLFMKNVYCKGADENLDTEFELKFLLEYFIKNDYVIGYSVDVDLWKIVERIYKLPTNDENLDLPSFTLSAKAWERIYELQKFQVKNKNVFVAMTFHKSAEDIRHAIKKGIENAQYSSLLMDEIVHNHQIVPEMLRLIEESRFIIMDITQPNYGAYYEAGYAQGLGKEVIITCQKDVWEQKDFTCEKDNDCIYKRLSTKPHFDIAQKQVLVWTDYSDLTKKLTEWIRHLIG